MSAPYCTAVESLDPTDKVRLYAIAALGPLTPGLTNDWILRELAASADRSAHGPSALGNPPGTERVLAAGIDPRPAGRCRAAHCTRTSLRSLPAARRTTSRHGSATGNNLLAAQARPKLSDEESHSTMHLALAAANEIGRAHV